METKQTKPGPKVEGGKDVERINLTLDSETIAKAKILGGGKVSVGIRRALLKVKVPSRQPGKTGVSLGHKPGA